jgi:hypothetical protein
MRLSTKNIDKRAVINVSRSIKTDSKLNIVMFGDNNDYPQLIEMLINGSKTAKSASKIYQKFLSGQGFENEIINNIIVCTNNQGKNLTVYDILKQCANSLSKNNGCYLHTDLTRDRKVKKVTPISFKFCRFVATDDDDYSPKIAVCRNWLNETDRTTNKLNTNRNSIKEYNVFNLTENVFLSQVKNAGGFDKYKGQMYFMFLDNEFLYPLSPFDSVYLDLDTESQISIFKNNTIRNGFLDKTIVRLANQTSEEGEQFVEDLKRKLGADGDQVIVIEDEIDPETNELLSNQEFKIEQLKAQITPDLFENWERSTANDIRKVINALPALLIDYEEGKLGGTSGESIIQATHFFNNMTKDDRKSIEQMFAEIFKHSENPILANNTNWKIKEFSIYEQPDNIQPTATDKSNIGEQPS